MCITTDTRGDNNGYYSVPDSTPTLCLTVIYKIKNEDFGVDDIVLYRGLSQMSGIINTCQDVCFALSTLIDLIEDTAIHYVGCETTQNGNDEDVDQINYYSPTKYTCNSTSNYAKRGDDGRPGPPAPFPPSTPRPTGTITYPTTTKATTTTSTTRVPTTTTKPITVPTTGGVTFVPTTITEPTYEPTVVTTTPEPITTGQSTSGPDTEPPTESTPLIVTIDTTGASTDEATSEIVTTGTSTDDTTSETDSTQATDTTSDDNPFFFEAAEVAAKVIDNVVKPAQVRRAREAVVVSNVAKPAQKSQTREDAQPSSSPSWTWPIMGSLAGLLALMVVALVVELVIARLIFKEVAKVGVSDDVPMS